MVDDLRLNGFFRQGEGFVVQETLGDEHQLGCSLAALELQAGDDAVHLGDAFLTQQAGVLSQVFQGRGRHTQQHGIARTTRSGDGDAPGIGTCLALAAGTRAEDVVRTGGTALGLRCGHAGVGLDAIMGEAVRLGAGRALLVALGVVDLAQVGIGLE